jgi:hypothetical protein
MSLDDPPPSQYPGSLILAMVAELVNDNNRLVKLNRAIALHRILIILLSSNPAYYVVIPALDILERSMTALNMEQFSRSFEGEGGFALLASVLAPEWRADIQATIMRLMIGVPPDGKERPVLACPPLLSTVLAALDWLLQNHSQEDEFDVTPSPSRVKSSSAAPIRSISISPMTSSK